MKLTTASRPATTFAPLIFVLGVSMVKELLEDVKRWRADREINARLVLVYDTNSKTFVDKRWRDIKVCSHMCRGIDMTLQVWATLNQHSHECPSAHIAAAHRHGTTFAVCTCSNHNPNGIDQA